MKPTKEIIEEIKKSFDEDIRNKLNPLYDISTSVHKETIKDLRELFEAVGTFAITKSNQEFGNSKKYFQSLQVQKEIEEKDKEIKELKENQWGTKTYKRLTKENISLNEEIKGWKKIKNQLSDRINILIGNLNTIEANKNVYKEENTNLKKEIEELKERDEMIVVKEIEALKHQVRHFMKKEMKHGR